MKVKDLIEELNNFDAELDVTVIINHNSWDDYVFIHTIESVMGEVFLNVTGSERG